MYSKSRVCWTTTSLLIAFLSHQCSSPIHLVPERHSKYIQLADSAHDRSLLFSCFSMQIFSRQSPFLSLNFLHARQHHAAFPKRASTISPDLVDRTDKRVSLSCKRLSVITGPFSTGSQRAIIRISSGTSGQDLHHAFPRSTLATKSPTRRPRHPHRT